MATAAKRMGRPTKKPKAGERVSLGLRVTADMKKRLDAAAASSGRSQSQEAEMRLERSFRVEEVAGGAEMWELTKTMTALFAFVAKRAATTAGHPEWTAKEWLADQDCYQSATITVCRTLIEGMPKPSADQIADTLSLLQSQLSIGLSAKGEIEGGSGFIKPKDAQS